MLGVSVHWLKTGFMDEVTSAGLDHNSKIYEIEDLNKPTSVIRSKGKDVISPIDSRKGAAYVHCLDGTDNVGRANVMLSYTWDYTIGTIISTLEDWCKSKGKDLKHTYVWICCLCVNQHRVAEKQKSGMTTSTEEFFNEFGSRVKNIGTILALMEPWDAPKYLTRIWCVFELYWAKAHNCNIEITMPQEQKDRMAESLIADEGTIKDKDIMENSKLLKGYKKLFDVLSKIDIEQANASVPDDKEAILKLIKEDVGYKKVNNDVNELLTTWVRKTILELVERQSNEIKENKSSDLESYANLCCKAGSLFHYYCEYDISMKMYERCFDVALRVWGQNHVYTANVYNFIGHILTCQADYDGALTKHKKAIDIITQIYGGNGENHPTSSVAYNGIGLVLMHKGNRDGALKYFRRTLTIQESVLEGNHLDIAVTYNNIAWILKKRGDYYDALEAYETALQIQQSNMLQENDPILAASYSNIGLVLSDLGDYDGALVHFKEAIKIQESVLGPNNSNLAETYGDAAVALYKKGEYHEALTGYGLALKTQLAVFGEDHPNLSPTYNNLGLVFAELRNYEAALQAYSKAIFITESTFGENDASLGGMYSNIGGVLYCLGDIDNSLFAFQKSYKLYKRSHGRNNSETKIAKEWIKTIQNSKPISRYHEIFLFLFNRKRLRQRQNQHMVSRILTGRI